MIRLAEGDRPSAILLHLHMLVMDGRELQRRLPADPEFSGIPLIVMTDVPNETDHEAARGAEVFLQKPFNQDVFLATVQRLCGRWVARRTRGRGDGQGDGRVEQRLGAVITVGGAPGSASSTAEYSTKLRKRAAGRARRASGQQRDTWKRVPHSEAKEVDLRAGVLSAKGASDLATNRGLSTSNRMVTGFRRVATRKAVDKCQNRPDVNPRIMDVCR